MAFTYDIFGNDSLVLVISVVMVITVVTVMKTRVPPLSRSIQKGAQEMNTMSEAGM